MAGAKFSKSLILVFALILIACHLSECSPFGPYEPKGVNKGGKQQRSIEEAPESDRSFRAARAVKIGGGGGFKGGSGGGFGSGLLEGAVQGAAGVAAGGLLGGLLNGRQ